MSRRVENHYHQSISRLQENLDLRGLQKQVGFFILTREGMRQHDENVAVMAVNLKDELGEVQEELEKYGTSTYDLHAAQTEAVDSGFFPLASVMANNIMIQPQEVMPYLNGIGNKSGITDELKEVGGNIEKKTLEKDVITFLRIYMAFIAGMPEQFNLQHAMADVLDKNDRNYPAEFFNGVHPVTSRKLNPDEVTLQYAHSRKCFKMIRMVHREILHQSDRDYGLERADWKKYSPLISDFENSELGHLNLLMKLSKDHELTDDQVKTIRQKFTG